MKLFEKTSQIENGQISVSKKHIDGVFYEHSHDFFEIEYICKGNGKHILNGEEYQFKEGNVYFLTPEDIHAFYPETDVTIYNVMFTEDFLSPKAVLPAIETCHGVQLSITPAKQDKIQLLFQQLCDEYAEKKEGQTEYMQCLLRCIFILLLRNVGKSPTFLKPSPIAASLVFIQSNFKENITLSQTAAQVNLSTGYFCELFKRYVGTGFSSYLTDLRLSYAAKALITTDEPITQIAYLSGFSAFSTFSRLFKQKYKISPSDYRKNKK